MLVRKKVHDYFPERLMTSDFRPNPPTRVETKQYVKDFLYKRQFICVSDSVMLCNEMF